jgi:hypothetical protein
VAVRRQTLRIATNLRGYYEMRRFAIALVWETPTPTCNCIRHSESADTRYASLDNYRLRKALSRPSYSRSNSCRFFGICFTMRLKNLCHSVKPLNFAASRYVAFRLLGHHETNLHPYPNPFPIIYPVSIGQFMVALSHL